MLSPPFLDFQNSHDFQFAVSVVEKLSAAGFTALWAGGCVRDLLLGIAPSDYDVATNAKPEQVRKVFGHKHTIPVGASFGVMMVVGNHKNSDSDQNNEGKKNDVIEVATFRTEGEYSDGRRPDSVTFCTPEEDAQRRDFTINGMFYDPIKKQLFDYVNGLEDLEKNRLRAIGRAEDRFQEDKLRMLRAVRFAARFNVDLEETTAQSIQAMAEQIVIVSWERVAQEFRKILSHPNRALGVQLCHRLKLFEHLFPEVHAQISLSSENWNRTLNLLKALSLKSFELALAILHQPLWDDSKSAKANSKTIIKICKRLKLSNQETDHIAWLFQNQLALKNAEQRSLAHLKRILAHPQAPELMEWCRICDQEKGTTSEDTLFCKQYLERTPIERLSPAPLITGKDLIDNGLKPSPEFKRLLDEIEEAQLNEEINTREEALAFLHLRIK